MHVLALCLALVAGWDQPASSTVRSDERVVLFPALGSPVEGGWSIHARGWIFEPELDSDWRRSFIEALGSAAPCEPQVDASSFNERARAFVVDNERGKSLALAIGTHAFVSEPSQANGHFTAVATVPAAAVERSAANRPLTLSVRLDAGDTRRFESELWLIPAEGLSVICDLDDTVRISHVDDPAALLRSTFCEPFRGITEVRDILKALRERGAVFHYVSASPWQLYEPLRAFMDAEGFPVGSFHLKTVRLRDETFLDLFKDAAAWRKPVIEDLMDRWPGRRFVLIGDCGESDPEIYAGLARARPEQVEHVYIRDAKRVGRGDARFVRAFEGVAAERWTLVSSGQK